jgi:hypothetical protein
MQLIANAFLWVHITLYRLTNGRIGGKFIAGSPILLLTTTGRRTGKQRTRPLAYVRDGDRFVLWASKRRLPSPSRLVSQPARHQPSRALGRPRAACRQRPDCRSHRAHPAVPPLCGDVQGRRRLRAQDQPPDPARGADPEHRLNMTEPAAGWSVSRNRHTNEALNLPRLGWCPNISGLASPR